MIMTNKKMTKKEMFSAMLTKYSFNEEEKAFIEHELELLAKKNSAERGKIGRASCRERVFTAV